MTPFFPEPMDNLVKKDVIVGKNMMMLIPIKNKINYHQYTAKLIIANFCTFAFYESENKFLKQSNRTSVTDLSKNVRILDG